MFEINLLIVKVYFSDFRIIMFCLYDIIRVWIEKMLMIVNFVVMLVFNDIDVSNKRVESGDLCF